MNRTVCIRCAGCYEARMECAQLQRFFELNGFQANGADRADLLVLYACGLTQRDAEMSVEIIKELKNRKKPSAELLVWGCLPKIDPRLVAEVHNGPIFGRRDIRRLEDMINAKVRYNDVTVNHLFPEMHDELQWTRIKHTTDPLTYAIEEINHQIRSRLVSYTRSDVFFIMTARGCLGNCSYCSELHSCGRLESKPVEKVVREFRDGLERGFRRFHLVSTDLGAYGRDLGYNLPYLLDEMNMEERDYELLLPNMNPRFVKDMIDEIVPTFRSRKISLLGIPAQSGSNRILQAMGRRYSVEDFKECVSVIKTASPKTLLWTQLMAGFPGEEKEDFEATLRLVDETPLDYVQAFRFSARPTTPASYLEKQVPEDISVNRYRKLLVKAIYKELGNCNGKERASESLAPRLDEPVLQRTIRL